MRDIKRLKKLYRELEEIHTKSFPDWRCGQLMFNFICECGDPFYWEEDKFVEELKKYANKTSPYCHWAIEGEEKDE